LSRSRHGAAELAALQRLLDESARSAGDALRETFEPEGHILSARQLAAYFDRGRGFALATVTAKGDPRVAPVGAVFYKAKFHVPAADYSRRVAHIERRNAVSLTHFVLSSIAVIVHGRAAVLQATDPDFAALEALHDGGDWWRKLRGTDSGVYLRVDPERVYSWAADPSAFPSWP
jgi:nitroimidazol reductase NimA-like FMN-containing flavoprotein (pyridoxamine 5'-phosphate oxidase superfamily)